VVIVANCRDVSAFLTAVRNRAATMSLTPADIATLQQLQLISYLSADQYKQIQDQSQALPQDSAQLNARMSDRNRLSSNVQAETRKTHSILFHLEGRDKQAATLQHEAQDHAALQAADRELAAEQQAFDTLVAQRSLLDTLTPCDGSWVALTALGARELRDLGFRLYRAADLDFTAYWAERQHIDQELNGVADHGAQYVAGLSGPLPAVDRSQLWAVAIGLAKLLPDVAQGEGTFMSAYNQIGGLAHNVENRLMSAEILSCLPRGVPESLPALSQLEKDVRKVGVPKESSLGVASILLLGQRADGTFATSSFVECLRLTASYESASLLAIVNRPDVTSKFTALRSLFASWGFQESEDVELAAAYLAVSELPVDGISTKLAILSKGLAVYLEFPLVAAAIMASIPVLEANESLNLLEEAYEIVGRRAMPADQSELICLAVRMVHGVRTETVSNLDATAPPTPTAAGYAYMGGPRFFFVPLIVVHGGYYSTYSGIGGAHPGHVHGGGGGFSG